MNSDSVARLRARVIRYLIEGRVKKTARLSTGKLCELLECAPVDVNDVVIDISRTIPKSFTLRWSGAMLTVSAGASESLAPSVQRVFDRWVERHELNPKRTKLTAQRRQAVEARLREGYPIEDLFAAVDGILRSEYHTDNGYTDLVHVCKSGARVERYRELAGEKRDLLARVRRAGR